MVEATVSESSIGELASGLRGRILELYPARTGRTPTVWEVDAAAGVAMIQP